MVEKKVAKWADGKAASTVDLLVSQMEPASAGKKDLKAKKKAVE